jgi:signal peptidase II
VIIRSEKLLPLLFLAVLAFDQLTKYIALSTLTIGKSVPFFGNYLRWTLVFNPGGAFSLRLGGSNYYLILSLIIFAVLIFYIIRNRHVNYLSIPLSIVSGGAAGNIIDRLRFGQVVDFIDCEFFDISIGSYTLDRWPIFNIADMAVSCGITVTVLLVIYHSRRKQQLADNENSSSKTILPDNRPE